MVGNWDTNVYYKVTESYTWTVPATIDFGENAGVKKESKVKANVTQDENLTKTGTAASSDNNWEGTAPKVMVTKNVIGPGKNLRIYIDTNFTENGKFYVETPKMTKDGPSQTEYEKLYYTITKPDADGGNGIVLTTGNNEVLRVPSGTDTDEQELVFTLTTTTTDTAEKAGTYNGKVVFKSELKPTT